MFRGPLDRRFSLDMFAFFVNPEFMPCPDCGASLGGEDPEQHVCDETRRVEYQVFRLRGDIARFELDFARYLDSPHGRFDAWYAERRRLATAA
jgi:hypothetical protein